LHPNQTVVGYTLNGLGISKPFLVFSAVAHNFIEGNQSWLKVGLLPRTQARILVANLKRLLIVVAIKLLGRNGVELS